MREKEFSSFTPDSGSSGTVINIEIPGGLEDTPPQSMMPLGAVLTGEDGSVFTTQDVAATDTETYSKFDLRIPKEIVLKQSYNIEINLMPAIPDPKIKGWKLTSTTGFKVTGYHKDGKPTLLGVRPNATAPSEYFLSATFQVYGDNLMQIDSSAGATLSRTKRKFNIIGIAPQQLVVKAAKKSPPIDDGIYYFNAVDKDGDPVRTGARITVKKIGDIEGANASDFEVIEDTDGSEE